MEEPTCLRNKIGAVKISCVYKFYSRQIGWDYRCRVYFFTYAAGCKDYENCLESKSQKQTNKSRKKEREKQGKNGKMGMYKLTKDSTVNGWLKIYIHKLINKILLITCLFC